MAPRGRPAGSALRIHARDRRRVKVLQIYLAFHRRRVLALQLSTLRQARRSDTSLAEIERIPIDVLTTVAASIVEARNDFTQYGATYYFRDLEADASLAVSRIRHRPRG